MRLTPELEITRQLSTFVNSRQELLIANARFVDCREFRALEGFSELVFSQVNHLTQALSPPNRTGPRSRHHRRSCCFIPANHFQRGPIAL